jgi:NTP pyrophosphatase (non-canonical NTP hydrolase)
VSASGTGGGDVDFKQYQEAAWRTGEGSVSTVPLQLSLGGLGIAGEAGEVADYLKKVIHHGHPLDEVKLKKELGDVLWYLSFICSTTGIPLEDVATANIEKGLERYPNGFSAEASLAAKRD